MPLCVCCGGVAWEGRTILLFTYIHDLYLDTERKRRGEEGNFWTRKSRHCWH